ncbi:hypothetical protein M9H77_03099 [Catharanthus roseus]|uniref:Uncharacterized protein n=1 Tax=Catharanthus roseus TaxID=4058 RepID=A0ACC0CAB9_CATRO|nr:hypothetical protein M9H77_03099 [Catharanthus roseus]
MSSSSYSPSRSSSGNSLSTNRLKAVRGKIFIDQNLMAKGGRPQCYRIQWAHISSISRIWLLSHLKKGKKLLKEMSYRRPVSSRAHVFFMSFPYGVRVLPEILSESRHIGAAATINFQNHACTMIGSTDRVRNLKRGHRSQVSASRSQYQPETQSTLCERSISHKSPHTPLITKQVMSPGVPIRPPCATLVSESLLTQPA